MRYWPAIALGLGVVASIALVFPLVQSQRHLTKVRAELGRTNEQLIKATSTISDLKTVLDSAQSQLTDRAAKLQELTAEGERARRDADQKMAAVNEASQSQINSLSKSADEAKAKVSEAEKQIVDLKEQLATASAQLQQTTDDRDAARSQLSETRSQAKTLNAALDQANAQIEQLKTELDERPLPPVSVSPPGENNPP